jgi:hypothetical protein
MFFKFDQNNSGGHFSCDDKVCHRVIIEATNTTDADDKAGELGVYFEGCDRGMDCSCCGDRLYSADTLVFPYTYGGFSRENPWSNQLPPDVMALKYHVKIVNNPNNKDKFDIVFKNVVDYAQFMADSYGATTPDVRIFYADGSVKEIFTEVKDEKKMIEEAKQTAKKARPRYRTTMIAPIAAAVL